MNPNLKSPIRNPKSGRLPQIAFARIDVSRQNIAGRLGISNIWKRLVFLVDSTTAKNGAVFF